MSPYHQRVCGERGRSKGCCGLLGLVHGEPEQARGFYEQLLLLKDIRHTLGS